MFHMLAPLTTGPRQNTSAEDENQVLNFVITSFKRVCPKPCYVAPPKMQGCSQRKLHVIKVCWLLVKYHYISSVAKFLQHLNARRCTNLIHKYT